jgi:hypothetical protein
MPGSRLETTRSLPIAPIVAAIVEEAELNSGCHEELQKPKEAEATVTGVAEARARARPSVVPSTTIVVTMWR